jgi:CRP/FNR family transcriptional regulator
MADPVHHSLVTALRAVPVFESFEEPELLELVGASANLCWPEGSTVFQPGSEAEALYIVLSGRVRISEDGRDIAEITTGQFFGELSLLMHTTHTKTAAVVEQAELMVLPKVSFQELLARDPEVAAHFRRTAEERLAGGS